MELTLYFLQRHLQLKDQYANVRGELSERLSVRCPRGAQATVSVSFNICNVFIFIKNKNILLNFLTF
jgi:hypothetical protein